MTMTPRRAELIAATLGSNEFSQNDWLDTVADQIYAAAGPRPGPITAGSAEIGGSLDQLRPLGLVRPSLEEQAVVDFASALSYLQKAKNDIAASVETVAAEAVSRAHLAVEAAADKAGRAADQAGADRAAAVSAAASAMLDTVRNAALTEQRQAQSDAVLVATAAAEAVKLAAQWTSNPDDNAKTTYAAMIAGIAEAAATAMAEQTRVRAVTMAQVAAAAAVAAAAVAVDAAVRMDHEVTTTASAVQQVANRAERLVAARTSVAAEVVVGSW